MIHIRTMTAADLPLGLRLTEQAGWNQTQADWQRFLDLQPDGCFVAEWAGTPVGTTTTLLFGPVGWVALVLVEESCRGRGIGTELVRRALGFLDGRGATTVRLDATPLGQPLYERLGFVPQFYLARYEGTLTAGPRIPPWVEAYCPEERDLLANLDEWATKTDRRMLLFRLFDERPEEVRVLRVGQRLVGYLTARPGRLALQLGPCVTSGTDLLFTDARHRHAGRRVFLDVPEQNRFAVRAAEEMGLTVQRRLLRMCRGPLRWEQMGALWASAGPELG
jgi:GNAT superfamily N-acetyltransferase